MRDTQIGVRMDADQIRWLRAEAKRRRTTVASLVREAVALMMEGKGGK